MPRTRRQQNLVETSLEKPLDLASDDERNVAPPREPKISRETKERLRNQQRSWVGRMYEYAKAFLQQGMERWETEGVGDCWLLTTPPPGSRLALRSRDACSEGAAQHCAAGRAGVLACKA